MGGLGRLIMRSFLFEELIYYSELVSNVTSNVQVCIIKQHWLGRLCGLEEGSRCETEAPLPPSSTRCTKSRYSRPSLNSIYHLSELGLGASWAGIFCEIVSPCALSSTGSVFALNSFRIDQGRSRWGKNRQFFSLIYPTAEITKYAYPPPPSPLPPS